MRTKMKIVKNWILAFVIAVLIGNSVSLIYERPTGWIDRENSSTPAIFNPGSVLVHIQKGMVYIRLIRTVILIRVHLLIRGTQSSQVLRTQPVRRLPTVTVTRIYLT